MRSISQHATTQQGQERTVISAKLPDVRIETGSAPFEDGRIRSGLVGYAAAGLAIPRTRNSSWRRTNYASSVSSRRQSNQGTHQRGQRAWSRCAFVPEVHASVLVVPPLRSFMAAMRNGATKPPGFTVRSECRVAGLTGRLLFPCASPSLFLRGQAQRLLRNNPKDEQLLLKFRGGRCPMLVDLTLAAGNTVRIGVDARPLSS